MVKTNISCIALLDLAICYCHDLSLNLDVNSSSPFFPSVRKWILRFSGA